MFLELNALFAQGQFTKSTVIVLLVITLIAAIGGYFIVGTLYFTRHGQTVWNVDSPIP